MTSPISMRTRFLAALLDQKGQPYQWGGKGGPRYWGFDCSGLVTWAWWKVTGQDWRETHNANTLLHLLPPPRLQVLRGGELVFYGKADGAPGVERGGNADHVMVLLGGCNLTTSPGGSDGLIFGACGGNRSCETPEASAALDAKVRARLGLDYRPDRIAIRDFRFPDEA